MRWNCEIFHDLVFTVVNWLDELVARRFGVNVVFIVGFLFECGVC